MDFPIRVVVVDDNACMLWGLKHFIASNNHRIEVSGAVSRRCDVAPLLRQHKPDVVLLEMRLDGQTGVEPISLVKEGCGARIIIFTDVRDPVLHEKAILTGAHGLVLKSEPVDVVVHAIRAVHAGELWLKRDVTARIVTLMATAYKQVSRPFSDSQFTPSEMRVISAAVKFRGAPNKVIASMLNMRPNTFRNHLSSIYVKLGIHRRLDLVLYGMQHGVGEEEAGGSLTPSAMSGIRSHRSRGTALVQAADAPTLDADAARSACHHEARADDSSIRAEELLPSRRDAKTTPAHGPRPHAVAGNPAPATDGVRLVRPSLRSLSPRTATRR